MPKLGEGAGVTAQVELLPDEIPLSAWDALFWPRWWRFRGGILYLTTLRLVWISWRPVLPWIPRVVAMSLPAVDSVRTRLVLFAPLIGLAGPFHRQVLVTLKDARRYSFSPTSGGPGATRIAAEINSIIVGTVLAA